MLFLVIHEGDSMRTFEQGQLPELADNTEPMGLQFNKDVFCPNGGGLTAPNSEVFADTPSIATVVAEQTGPLALQEVPRP